MGAISLRAEDGTLLPLEPGRWLGATTPLEEALLADITAPVLDVGCGPGRVVDLLARRGAIAVGVDPSPGAVALARQRGCPVLQRSIFDRLPFEGRWGSVVLLDGNIGIGGDPVRLLRRCRDLLRPGGSLVVEVEAPPTTWRACRARLERDGASSAWFPWAVVGAEAIGELAAAAGLRTAALSSADAARWFAVLGRGQ